MRSQPHHNPRAFTLVELLVVVAIIALLIAILLPIVRRAHQSAQNQVCKSNLRQIGFGVQMYLNDNRGRYPDPYTLGGARFRRLVGERDPADAASLPETYGWSALLQPYFKNRSEKTVWLCPATREDFAAYKNSYAWDTPFASPNSREARARPGALTMYENWQFGPYKPGVLAPLPFPPGYEFADQWRKGLGLVPTQLKPATLFQNGPHHYRLDRSAPSPFKEVSHYPPDGYSHALRLDYGIQIYRHYKIIIFPDGFSIQFPEPVE